MLKLRLKRNGRKRQPSYRLVIMENTTPRSEEHTSDSSHITISYAVFCLKKKNKKTTQKKQ